MAYSVEEFTHRAKRVNQVPDCSVGVIGGIRLPGSATRHDGPMLRATGEKIWSLYPSRKQSKMPCLNQAGGS